MGKRVILLDVRDSVAVAVEDLDAGETCDVTGADARTVMAMERVPRGHKIALDRTPRGGHVVKYGHSIGIARCDIERGSRVHSHNLESGLTGRLDYRPPDTLFRWNGPATGISLPETFLGYRRADGSVGVRNEIWVLPTVGCVNKTAERLVGMARTGLGLDTACYTHPFGCSQLGGDLENTQKILAGLVNHPNAAGVLVLSLGCETNRLDAFQEALETWDDRRVKFLSMQDSADDEAEAMKLLGDLGRYAEQFERQELPVSELVLGMKCGGSDAFSGITANPLVGHVSDIVVQAGGSVVLTEVPEMFGAETVLMDRAGSRAVFDAIVSMVNDFKEYFLRHDQPVYENPSPGNRDGGITTLEEKSLGCIRKSGTSPVEDVIPYGAHTKRKGLTLLSAPGNDLVSTTALCAAGAQVILFTTGRGTPFGAPSPTIKISTNTDLARRKPGWIDFDAGRLLEGKSFTDLGAQLFSLVVAVANGAKTKSELTGNRDIAIFKDGVVL